MTELNEASGNFRAESRIIPHPFLKGRMATVYDIHDSRGAHVGVESSIYISSPEDAVRMFLERLETERTKMVPKPNVPVSPVSPSRRIAPVRPALSYHFTTAAGIRGILASGVIRAESGHILGDRHVKGVSLTRNRYFDFEAVKPFRLALDFSNLAVRPRTFPVRDAYMRNSHKAEWQDDGDGLRCSNEAEEFLPGSFFDVEETLVEIGIVEDLLSHPEGDPDALRAAVELEVPSGVRLVALERPDPFVRRERHICTRDLEDLYGGFLTGRPNF